MEPENIMRTLKTEEAVLKNADLFSKALFEKIQLLCPAAQDMEQFEFSYAMENVVPDSGWETVRLSPMGDIEMLINDENFYKSIQLKPKEGGRLVMDKEVLSLTQMLFVGLATERYPLSWVDQHFSFDLRGFYFIHRTLYYNNKIIQHMGGKPYRLFARKQKEFDKLQSIGYKEFKSANAEIDQCFIDLTKRLAQKKGTPIIIAIAGQTAAGKTEIVERLRTAFTDSGKTITVLEMDHFLTDRDYREAHGIDSLGKESLHFEMLKQSILELLKGKAVQTPQYDFVDATSSHTLEGKIKEGCESLRIEPADIIFMEGNFPFLLPEIADLIGIKIMYLTDDSVRLKRKWKRDMVYRKKYELYYFLNRYFKEQYLMAQQVYIPQMENSDLIVDTTRAEIWMRPAIQTLL